MGKNSYVTQNDELAIEQPKPKVKVHVEHWNGKAEGKPDINDWRIGASGVKKRLEMELSQKIEFEFNIEEFPEKIFRVTIGNTLVHERKPDDAVCSLFVPRATNIRSTRMLSIKFCNVLIRFYFLC